MSAANFQALPHSEESERAVLAAILLSPSFMPLVAARLKAEDFYLDRHQAIFRAMAELDAALKPIDLRTLQARLELVRDFEMVGGLAYLTSLDLMLPDISQTMHYVEVVKETATRRRLYATSMATAQACLTAGAQAAELVANSFASLQQMAGDADPKEPRQAWRPAVEMASRLREQVAGDSPFSGFYTGLESVDSVIVGLERQTLSLWIADPGAGKTAWSLQVAEAVNRAGWRVYCVSLEMTEQALVRRMACRALRIPISMIARGQLSTWQVAEIERFAEDLKDRDFLISEKTYAVAEEVARIKAQAARGVPPDLLVFDYLQLAHPPESGRRAGDADWKANGAICKALIACASEVNAHALVLGQANEKGLVHGGGGWQEAELFVRMRRPWMKDRDPMATPGERAAVVFEVIKNRLGQVGDVAAEFDGGSQTFREVAGDLSQSDFQF